MAEIQVVVVTPEATVFDQKSEFVVVPLYDGEAGIAPNHAPMIGRLGYGELRIKSATGEKTLYVDGGFVQVANNVVSILTGSALEVARLKKADAEALLEKGNKMVAKSPETMAIRDRLLAQGRGQLRLLSKKSGH